MHILQVTKASSSLLQEDNISLQLTNSLANLCMKSNEGIQFLERIVTMRPSCFEQGDLEGNHLSKMGSFELLGVIFLAYILQTYGALLQILNRPRGINRAGWFLS